MSISAEMFIVVSLMLAVFAAIAAIGTSVVLGVGYERLRSGFEIVKKQTGFFADAIHKLDERTNTLDQQNASMKKAVSGLDTRVDRVEKQSSFFFESLNSLESQILTGQPATAPDLKDEAPVEDVPMATKPSKKKSNIVMPQVMEWSSISDAKRLLQAEKAKPEPMQKQSSNRLTSTLHSYFTSDNSADSGNKVVYH